MIITWDSTKKCRYKILSKSVQHFLSHTCQRLCLDWGEYLWNTLDMGRYARSISINVFRHKWVTLACGSYRGATAESIDVQDCRQAAEQTAHSWRPVHICCVQVPFCQQRSVQHNFLSVSFPQTALTHYHSMCRSTLKSDQQRDHSHETLAVNEAQTLCKHKARVPWLDSRRVPVHKARKTYSTTEAKAERHWAESDLLQATGESRKPIFSAMYFHPDLSERITNNLETVVR